MHTCKTHLNEEVAALGGILIPQCCKVPLSSWHVTNVHCTYASLHLDGFMIH